jgi:membrane-bound lytic murein transglycosylase D
MNLIRQVGMLALSGLLFTAAPVRAQEVPPTSPAPAVEENYDPIVAMLDSLVTLNHVIRYNNLDGNCFDATASGTCAGPQFSDEVYSERINNINSPIPLSYNRYVKEFIELYANRKRGLTQRVMGLSNLYFPVYEEVMDKEGIPLEFKYLSIVESALNPIAVSRVGATGPWQFMYQTGLLYNLKVNSFTDERKDVYKATEAACQYFKDMYKIYGDWLLVIASYNCGAGNVNRAIKRSGGKTNFWEIMPYLPKETRGYVPAFIAVTYVMNYTHEHNLYPVAPAYNYFQVDTIRVNGQVNFNTLASTIDLPLEVISYLNPIYKRNIIPASTNGESYLLRLPSNKIAAFMTAEQSIYAQSAVAKPLLPVFSRRDEDLTADNSATGAKYTYTTKRIKKVHKVRRGETLSDIADMYECSTQEIKKANHLHSQKLKAGQRLNVVAIVRTRIKVKEAPENLTARKDSGNQAKNATASATPPAKDVADSANKEVAQATDSASSDEKKEVAQSGNNDSQARFIYHLVQPGDTLWNIAKRYEGVTVEMIKDINNLHNTNIKPGTRLKVIVNG